MVVSIAKVDLAPYCHGGRREPEEAEVFKLDVDIGEEVVEKLQVDDESITSGRLGDKETFADVAPVEGGGWDGTYG